MVNNEASRCFIHFKQESFHAHFPEGLHQRESDWAVRLTHQVESVDDLSQTDSYWQQELDTFQPNGLNERDVAPS